MESRNKLIAMLVALLCFSLFAIGHSTREESPYYILDDQLDADDEPLNSIDIRRPVPFQNGMEYNYRYDAQIATGLVSSFASAEPNIPEQKAVTRMQAFIGLRFLSERQALLQLRDVRIGALNDLFPQYDRVAPIELFESKEISREKLDLLQLPVKFIYVDGLIQRIQFHQRDDTWSENIKRAVLNMIQLNLKRNGAQELEFDATTSSKDDDSKQFEEPKSFKMRETTIEGECQVLYSIGGFEIQNFSRGMSRKANDQLLEGEQLFNVTKSIDFSQCSKLPDVSFGFPFAASNMQETDQKVVKSNRLSRSTTMRFMLLKRPKNPMNQAAYNNDVAIERTEITSHYVLKSLQAQTSERGSAMHAAVSAELVFRSAKPVEMSSRMSLPREAYTKDGDLLFSTQWDTDLRQFYAYGEQGFPSGSKSSFSDLQREQVIRAEQALRKLVQIMMAHMESIENQNVSNSRTLRDVMSRSKHFKRRIWELEYPEEPEIPYERRRRSTGQQFSDIEAPIQLQRVVEALRMLSMDKLKQMDQTVSSSSPFGGEIGKQLFADALAISGTRNTVFLLVQKILAGNIPASTAAKALVSLQGLPVPSDAIVQSVQRLTQSEVVQESKQLKQSAWLVFGTLLNELCNEEESKIWYPTSYQQQYDKQFEKRCPSNKKQLYMEALTELLKSANNIEDKLLALKAIGNAGLTMSLPVLDKAVNDDREELIVRITAVDAMRRLRAKIPRKLQAILMPIFMNNRERSGLRIAAFTMIMRTLPSAEIIDQIATGLSKERATDVYSYSYRILQVLSKTVNPGFSRMRTSIRNALKLLNADEQMLKSSSGTSSFPLFSKTSKEGIFVNIISMFDESKRQMLPNHFGAHVNSVFNDEIGQESLALSYTQTGFNTLMDHAKDEASVQRFISKFYPPEEQTSRNFYNMFDAKGGFSERTDPAFALINFRIFDADQFFIPISAGTKHMPITDRLKMLPFYNFDMNKQFQFQRAMAINMLENKATIATSIGLSLGTFHSMPTLSFTNVRVSLQDKGAQFQAQLKANVAHMRKIKIWLPIVTTGVQSIHLVHCNLPLDIAAKFSPAVEVRIATPKSTTRLIGIQTLPTTYTADFIGQSQQEKTLKTVHSPAIEQSHHDVLFKFGESFGLPFAVKGHYHRPLMSYPQIVQMLMAGENQVHLVFEPTSETPREVVLRANAFHFEKLQQPMKMKFGEFYSKEHKFGEARMYQDRRDFEPMESEQEQQEKLSKFLQRSQQRFQSMYRHGLELSAQAIGGQKEARAAVKVELSADPQFKLHRIDVNVECLPFGGKKWTLRANAQCMGPDTVKNISELFDYLFNNDANKNLFVQGRVDWGNEDSKETRKYVSIRLRGEHAIPPSQQQMFDDAMRLAERVGSVKLSNLLKRQSIFINKFDIVAEYKTDPSSRFIYYMFSLVYEHLKTQPFENITQLEQNVYGKIHPDHGVLHITLTIDPFTQSHANVSIKMPSEFTHIQSLKLPTKLRPFSLVRPTKEFSTIRGEDRPNKEEENFESREDNCFGNFCVGNKGSPFGIVQNLAREDPNLMYVPNRFTQRRRFSNHHHHQMSIQGQRLAETGRFIKFIKTPSNSSKYMQMSNQNLMEIVDELLEKFDKTDGSSSGTKRGILGWISHQLGFGENKVPSLPQDASPEELEMRRQALRRQQREYQFDYQTNLPKTPMLATKPSLLGGKLLSTELELPFSERPSHEWKRKVISTLLRIVDDVNQETILNSIVDNKKVYQLFSLITIPDKYDARPTAISDYNLFFDEKDKRLPRVASEYDFDAAFARWRLAGPNPMMIKPCTKEFLETNMNIGSLKLKPDVQMMISAALESKRLFVCDYSMLATMKSSRNGKYQKYNSAPIALFEMPEDMAKRNRQWLEPLAIQCEPISARNPTPPMFSPDDGFKWKIAKAIVNSADGDYHEVVVHLAHTHLAIEPFMITTHRQLPPTHPVYALLLPHFEGTALINHAADKSLINPGGGVDKLVNQDIHQLNEYASQMLLELLSDDFSFPALIKRRNMDNDSFPATFPYRDDGMLLWDAIYQWVNDYLRIYYESEDKIGADFELMAWIDELQSDGRVHWLQSFDKSRAMLAKLLSAIIFTASCQHAAVNMPQEQIESYVPAFPLAMYKPPPGKNDQTSEADYLDTLPPLQMAWLQKKTAYLLAGVYYTQLGQYEPEHFVDARVKSPLQKFKNTLESAEMEIKRRNKQRMEAWKGILSNEQVQNWNYEYLLPSKVPQSINI